MPTLMLAVYMIWKLSMSTLTDPARRRRALMGAVAGPLTKSSPRTLGEAARDAHGSNVAASSMTGIYLRVMLTAL